MFLIAAISLGFLGSFHCIGMCGPIALALPIYQKKTFSKILSILFYNAGRVFTYACLGVLFGFIGQGFALAGLQQILSIGLGCLILLVILLPQKKFSSITSTQKLFQLIQFLKASLAERLRHKSLSSLFILGSLNGLLPCGLVYMAITAAVASSSVLQAMLFMVFFGSATIPLMFSITFFRNLISVPVRGYIHKTIPYLSSMMAILLIVRGLNLNIPYLSPQKNTETGTFAACHDTNQINHKTKLCIGPNSVNKK